MRISDFLDSVRRDFRHTLRGFQQRTLFSLAVILTLALGVGATTAIFSVVNAVVIKPLPYPDSDAVVTVTHSAVFGNVRNNDFPFSAQMLEIYSLNDEVFEELGMYTAGQTAVTGEGSPEQTNTLFVTAGTLWALNVQPVLGRWFLAEDDQPGAAETLILSNDYWQRRFGGDPSVIGRTVVVDGLPREVIGVMPPLFSLRGTVSDLILPMRLDMAQPSPAFCCAAVGRLKPGATVADANTEIDRMLPAYLDRYMRPAAGPQADALQLQAAVRPLKDDVIGNIGQVLWVLLGSIGILLLIACANIANLLLLRAEARGSELAVRAALGAASGHLVRGLMIESLTLSAIGGLIGVALAFGGLQFLLAFPPANLPRLNEIAIDVQVLGFAFAVSTIAGLVFGMVPIAHATRQQWSHLASFIRGGGRWASAGRHQNRSRNALVVAQIALALVMLISSGLMMRTFQNLRDVEPGFTEAASVQTVRLSFPPSTDAETLVLTQEQILTRLAAIPGVESAAYATTLPMQSSASAIVAAENEAYENGELPPTRRIVGVSPGLQQTLGVTLLAGRDFSWEELHEQRNVVQVSETYARETWQSVDGALGQRLRVGTDGTWQEIVGVVADVYHDGVDQEPAQTVYWPARSHLFVAGGAFTPGSVAFALRTDRANTESLLVDIRRVVSEVVPDRAITQVATLETLYRNHPSMARSAFSLALLGIAGVMALLLSIVGIYGVLAYTVMQRQREVGIRIALGAAPDRVKSMFVYRGMLLAGAGIVIGVVVAFALTRLMATLLFGVAPVDGLTFAAAAAFLGVATFFACYLPARRAAQIDPMATLGAD